MKQTDQELPKAGLITAIVVAVCCLAPILVLLLGGAGLEALTGSLGYALVLVLVILVMIAGYMLWRRLHR